MGFVHTWVFIRTVETHVSIQKQANNEFEYVPFNIDA